MHVKLLADKECISERVIQVLQIFARQRDSISKTWVYLGKMSSGWDKLSIPRCMPLKSYQHSRQNTAFKD